MIQTLLFLTAFVPASCQGPGVKPSVTYISRSEFLRAQNTFEDPRPFVLTVRITADGRLSLNGIDTGSVDDTGPLAKNLASIFDDRAAHGITIRQVIVDSAPGVRKVDMQTLIQCLNSTGAGIRILND